MTAKHIKFLIGAVVLVLVATFAFFYFTNKAQPPAAAGDCVKVELSPTELVKTACDDRDAVFVVAKRVDGGYDKCPKPGHYVAYPPQDAYKAGEQTYCLMMNAKKGDCFTRLTEVDKARRVDCASAEFEVLGILEGVTDPYRCGDVEGTSGGFVYSEPPRLICGKRNVA